MFAASAGYTYPNGVSTTLQYDGLNRLTSLGSQSPLGAAASYVYTPGTAGNRTGVTELSGRQVTYGYDNLYRLTSETITGVAMSGVVSYTYDAVGNRKQITSTLAAIPASGLLNYDANDRTATDTYDNNGNIVSQGGIADSYDYENHLVQHGYITYVYDGDGNRVAKTIGGVSTSYLVDTLNPTGYAQVLDEVQNSSAVRSYTWGLQLVSESQLVAATPPAIPWVTSYYGFDGHGSVRYLTNSTGAVTDSYDYDAFGNLINSTGSTPNNYFYSGEQFDPELGLYYNRARYLDVRSGRFWGMDSYEGNDQTPISLHKYLYSSADPADWTDPTGFLTDYRQYWQTVETQIQIEYTFDHLGNEVLWGQPTGVGKNPLLKPDIFDFTRKIWMDVKPLSASGVADAAFTLTKYNNNFAPAYNPDTSWEPSYQPLYSSDGKMFYVHNVQGILFYTCDTSRNRLNGVSSITAAGQLVQQLKREEQMGNAVGLGLLVTGAVGMGMLLQYATSSAAIANTLQLTDIQNSVGNSIMLDTLAPAA